MQQLGRAHVVRVPERRVALQPRQVLGPVQRGQQPQDGLRQPGLHQGVCHLGHDVGDLRRGLYRPGEPQAAGHEDLEGLYQRLPAIIVEVGGHEAAGEAQELRQLLLAVQQQVQRAQLVQLEQVGHEVGHAESLLPRELGHLGGTVLI